jgi:hypothetical protein
MKNTIVALLMGVALLGGLSVVVSSRHLESEVVPESHKALSIEKCLTLLRDNKYLELSVLGICQSHIEEKRLVYDTTCQAWYQH